MQKRKCILLIFITTISLYILVQLNKSTVYAETIEVGKTWEYHYRKTNVSYNDQEFVAPVAGVYEFVLYGATNEKINLRVKNVDNPDVLVKEYQIQGGKGAKTVGYLRMEEGEKIFVHIMKGNSAGQIEQTPNQLQNIDLSFGTYCFITKTGTYYDEQARIYTTGDRVLTANAGAYHCNDYQNGYGIDGDGVINLEECKEITYKGVTYLPRVEQGGSPDVARCMVTLKAVEDNNATYKVNHWQQNINGIVEKHDSTNYTLKETENLTGTIATSISPSTKTYSGFTSPEKQTITIKEDSTTTIDYYYTRNKYQYTLGECEGVITTNSTPSGSYYYGSMINLKASVEEGYVWSKWSNNDNKLQTTVIMPDNDLTINPIATKKSVSEPEPEPEQPRVEDSPDTPRDSTQSPATALPDTGKISIIIPIMILVIIGVNSYIIYKKFPRD